MPTFTLTVDTVTTLVFFFVVGAYTVFTAVFYYHWQHYGTDTKVTLYTLVAFFVTTVPLLVVLGIMTLLI